MMLGVFLTPCCQLNGLIDQKMGQKYQDFPYLHRYRVGGAEILC